MLDVAGVDDNILPMLGMERFLAGMQVVTDGSTHGAHAMLMKQSKSVGAKLGCASMTIAVLSRVEMQPPWTCMVAPQTEAQTKLLSEASSTRRLSRTLASPS